MDRDKKILTGNIEVKLTADGKHWYVAACSANIENKDCYATPPGDLFPTKDEAVAQLKRHIMAWFKEKGRSETEENVEWRVP